VGRIVDSNAKKQEKSTYFCLLVLAGEGHGNPSFAMLYDLPCAEKLNLLGQKELPL
jgi:hypothetical protein